MNMRVVRRMLVTGAFILLTLLIITAASTYYDLLYLFYPSFCRELLGYLAEQTAKLDFVVWQTALIIAIAVAFVMLIVRIVLRKNILIWLFSITAVASIFLCLFMLMWGANQYGPSIAEPLRLDMQEGYSVTQLEQATEYYRDQANACAEKLEQDQNGLTVMPAFETLANQVGSGFRNMTRTCYIFGGSTVAPKQLRWPGLLSKLNISSLMVCYTGEAGVNPRALPAALPYLMGRTVAQRMSIVRNDDPSFASILTCIASDSPEYQYSGYFMAYQFCYNILQAENPSAAERVHSGAGDALRADCEANRLRSEDEEASDYLPVSALSVKPEAENTICDLLVAWHLRLTTPEPQAEEVDSDVIPGPDEAVTPPEDGEPTPEDADAA